MGITRLSTGSVPGLAKERSTVWIVWIDQSGEVVAHVPKDIIKQMSVGKDVGIYFIGEPVYLNDKEKSFISRFYNDNML